MSTQADHLSYRRASGVALIGLAIQFALALALFLYGILGGDPGARYASFAIMLGIPVWVAVWLVLNQHRLERVEAIENEALERAGATSAFGDGTQADLAQANRLAWMHRVALPALSVIMALAYAGVGIIIYRASTATTTAAGQETTYTPPEHTGWAIAISVGVAVIGFVFARFVAGMGKQSVWMLLNSGAGFAVLNAVLGVLLLAAHLLSQAQYDWLSQHLPSVVGILMVALAAEIVLNFLLTIYRPRKPGEYMRPALDSRVLGFLAAPDRLAQSLSEAVNYQFGFDVSSTWFFKLISRWIAALIIFGALLVWSMSSLVVIEPDERALLLRNGNLVGEELEPGLHLTRPWPFDRIARFPATAINEFIIGTPKHSDDGKPLLWTDADAVNETFFTVQAGAVTRALTPEEQADSTADLALLSMEIPVQYQVEDLKQYYSLAADGPSSDPEANRREILTSIASNVIYQELAKQSVERLLGAGRSQIASSMRQTIQDEFNNATTGVRVIFVGLAAVHPGKDAAGAFQQVVASDQQRQTLIERSRAEYVSALSAAAGDVDRAEAIIAALDEVDQLTDSGAPAEQIAERDQAVTDLILNAGGQAANLIASARAERWKTHLRERARAERRTGQAALFSAGPSVFMAGRFLDAIRSVSSGARVFFVPSDVALRLNQEEIVRDLSLDIPSEEEN